MTNLIGTIKKTRLLAGVFPVRGDLYTPIFIGGEGRSGTTLMRVMLNNHRSIACGPETQWFLDPGFTGLYEIIKEKYQPNLISYDEPPEELLNRMFRAFISSHHGQYASKQGKKRWADKSPYNIKKIDFFLKVFDYQMKFIHMVRDGRDVISSLVTMDWGPQSIEEAAKSWHTIIRNSRRHIGKDYFLEIRYEDLIRDPEHILRKVCEFLNIRFDKNMLNFYKQGESIGGSHESSYDQVRKPIYSSSIGRWKRDLSAEQVKVVTEICIESLKSLGYE